MQCPDDETTTAKVTVDLNEVEVLSNNDHKDIVDITDDIKILCDPWNSKNPAFYNTWYVYPFNDNLDWKNYLDVDVLYVSHLHKDHFDEETLKLLSKDITIVIPEFRQNRLIDKLKRFKNII